MCEKYHQMPVSFEECSNSIWPHPIFRNSIWPQPIFLRSGEPSTRPAVVSFCDPSLNSKCVVSGSWDRIQYNFKQLTTRPMRPRPIPSAVLFLDPVLEKRFSDRILYGLHLSSRKPSETGHTNYSPKVRWLCTHIS